MQYEGHEDGITSIAISKDMNFVLTGSMDCNAILYHLKDGKIARKLEGHKQGINSVSISYKNVAVTSSIDGSVIIWNLFTGKAIRSHIEQYNHIHSVSINNGGNKVILGLSDKISKMWDLKNGEQEFTSLSGHKSIVNSVQICEYIECAVTGSDDNESILWNLKSGEIIQK